MKLYIKSDNIYGYIPLSSKPISESTISTVGSFVDSVNNIIPKQTPGSFKITNVEYKVYQAQALKSTVPELSSKQTYTYLSKSGNSVYVKKSTRTLATKPLTFSETELLNLVDILTLLAKNSHTHSSSVGSKTSTSQSGDVTPSTYTKCTNHNNGGNGENSNGWWW